MYNAIYYNNIVEVQVNDFEFSHDQVKDANKLIKRGGSSFTPFTVCNHC